MSDKDVDAKFADIVAHWDDVASYPEREVVELGGPASGADTPTTPGPGVAGGERTGAELPDTHLPDTHLPDPERPSGSPAGTGQPSTGHPDGEAHGTGHALPGPVNPSPLGVSIPVWRGATGPPSGERDAGLDAPGHEDDHFEPGPTAPLPPQEDLHFWGIVVGLVAGPLLLLWLVIFKPHVSGWWTLGALGLTVGGFVLLVLRQPLSRDDDDPDNGARV